MVLKMKRDSKILESLANIFMCHFEEKWLDQCPSNFKPIFYRRYVDDTFLLFRERSHVQLFLDYFNSKHVNINFTQAIEHNFKLSFLDCTVTRCGEYFNKTSVFRKSSFTGLGTSFYSFCSFNFKLNCISTLVFRAFNICSDSFNFDKELCFLKSFFRDNGFCSHFLTKQFNKCINV